jgi:excisionase family DNA binding protein
MTNTAQPVWQSIHLLTVPEVAEWARVHPKTIYRWIKIGEIEAIQLGARTYRIPETAVVEYLQRNGYNHLIQQAEK